MISIGTTLPLDDPRVIQLADVLANRYHTGKLDPIELTGEGNPLLSIVRIVPGDPKGLDEMLLLAANAAGFNADEVKVSVLPDPDYWE